MKIAAEHKPFAQVNEEFREAIKHHKVIDIEDARGQKYLAIGAKHGVTVNIYGTPGNDMAAFLSGAKVEVFGNAQDQVGNTMDGGEIIIHGRVGDAAGYAMRDGVIFAKNECGYRCGIHMKEYRAKKPVIVIGGGAGSFLGEYMAGGTIVLLGIGCDIENGAMGYCCGTGIHGGRMYIRGAAPPHKLSRECCVCECDADDMQAIAKYVKRYCEYFGADFDEIMKAPFKKIVAASSRPYNNIYCSNKA
ncbi:MAG: hypothetical protein Q4C12_01920 [Clostridia bacterium]|nr:hypothetical protein [Clostridia bacterium]